MNDQVNLSWALQNEVIKHIDEVENGIASNCEYPQCNSPLIARNGGLIKAHHFAHATDPTGFILECFLQHSASIYNPYKKYKISNTVCYSFDNDVKNYSIKLRGRYGKTKP